MKSPLKYCESVEIGCFIPAVAALDLCWFVAGYPCANRVPQGCDSSLLIYMKDLLAFRFVYLHNRINAMYTNNVKLFIRKQGKRFTDAYIEKQQIEIKKCRLVLHIQVYATLVSSY